MPEIIIHLTDKEFKKVKNTISYNGKTDLEHETFSGTELKIGLTPFGNFLQVKGYITCEIENVLVEFKKD
jgi:hypothetical protein